MRRMHTKEEIFEFVAKSPTAAALAELIANTVAFDRDDAQESGLVKVQMIGGDRGIKTEDIPEHDGVYKTDYEGIFVKTHTGQYSYKVLALFNNNFYIQDRDNTTETDFLFVAANLLVKPIYCHPITMYGVNGEYHLTCLIFNNKSTPLTTVDELITEIRSWGLDVARIMTSGAYISNNNKPAIASYITVRPNSVNLIGNDANDCASSSADLEILTVGGSFDDGINRIN